jgi:hypothetical protein
MAYKVPDFGLYENRRYHPFSRRTTAVKVRVAHRNMPGNPM